MQLKQLKINIIVLLLNLKNKWKNKLKDYLRNLINN